MGRFQPVLPLLKNNITRRRGRTWQILGLVVLLFLGLTFIAVRYLPTVVIDPISVLKNRDFKDIFVPPIPRPPVNRPNQDHNHSLHLSNEKSRLQYQIDQNKENVRNSLEKNPNEIKNPIPDKVHSVIKTESLSLLNNLLPVDNLTQLFSHMTIEELQKIKSVPMRREKAREVSYLLLFFYIQFYRKDFV